jgi:uncharacterized protein YukE
MAVIDFHPEEITKFLKDVDEANAQMHNMAEKISKAVKEVEPKWQGDTQKAFFVSMAIGGKESISTQPR